MVAIVTVVVGALLLWFGLSIRADAVRGTSWPTVQGKILERGTAYYAPRNWYYPHVKYTYRVDGKDYTADQVYQRGRVDGTQANIQKLVDSLPDPVPVHYDPAAPSTAFLIPNPSWTYAIVIAFGVLALIVGLIQTLAAFGKPAG